MGIAQIKRCLTLGGLTLACMLAIAACARADIDAAKYSHKDCRRVALIDVNTGVVIRGAEDLALDDVGERLFVSAYDRRAVEKAAGRKGAPPLNGGVYAVALGQLFNPETKEIAVISLAAPGDFAGGLRPHGITFDKQNKELIFINRTYAKSRGGWKMTPTLQRIGANGEAFVGSAQKAPCAANNLVTRQGEVLTSFDHAGCGWAAGFENIFRLKRSGFADGRGKLYSKAAFANGLVSTPEGDIVLAATREHALLLMSETPEGFGEIARTELPGAPDNLTIAEDGLVAAAVHPSLLKLALNRKFGVGRAPSRIVKASLDTGNVSILFDDPKGEIFSAATTAVEINEGLVAGSVSDTGLLVCRGGS